MQQHRNIDVGGATLECTLDGSGTPVVLLANAGCGTGYFADLARVLAAGGLRTITINMRGTGESRGSLDGTTLHDLAADVAGVLEALDGGPAHLVGHAFGNRVARCLAVDRPALVRSVTLLAAGGLIAPSTPLGTNFRNATEVKMNGSDCVTVLGARWCRRRRIRKCSRRSIAGRRCSLRISRPAGGWRSRNGGTPEALPFSRSRGLMMKSLRRAMATRSASNSASASGLSTCRVRDTFCCWSSPKPLPAPSSSSSAPAQVLADGLREIEGSEMPRYGDTFVDRLLREPEGL